MPRNLDKPMKPPRVNPDGSLYSPDTIQIQTFGYPTSKNPTQEEIKCLAASAKTVNMRFDGRYGTESKGIRTPSTIKEKGLPGRPRRSKKKGKFGGNRWLQQNMSDAEYYRKKFHKDMKARNRLLVKLVWGTLLEEERKELVKLQSKFHNEWMEFRAEIVKNDNQLVHSQLCKMILQTLRRSRTWMEFEDIVPNPNFQGKALEILEDWANRKKVEKNTMGGVLSYRKVR